MMTDASVRWIESNQRSLTAALSEVRILLEAHTRGLTPDQAAQEALPPAHAAVEEITRDMDSPPALDQLCDLFGLSEFERWTLLLSVGIELESSFAALCARAYGDASLPYPTFNLALAALPGAHWSALLPAAPLRYWRLVELAGGIGLTASRLQVDERILHYLAGIDHPDDRLAGYISPVAAGPGLPSSYKSLAGRAAAALSGSPNGRPPVIQLTGPQPDNLRAVAAEVSTALGLNLYALPAAALPLDPRELEALARLWAREAALSRSALVLDCGEFDPVDAAREHIIQCWIEHARGVLILTGRDRQTSQYRPLVTLEVGFPSAAEQRCLWEEILPITAERQGALQLDAVTVQFRLSPTAMQSVAFATGEDNLPTEDAGPDSAGLHHSAPDLWDLCREQVRPNLENLAQRINACAGWDDLVLPEFQLRALREIAAHARRRQKVYESWGFASKEHRGLGISVLFSGPSGVGKTMAAEVLARELRLDLYHIDLSQVVSKYIGETEKNLRRLFDAAEAGGAILLFDEADALFGRRSEVKDSHDRYANVEISYLLQRMEAYRGLAILTTNLKSALDPAFLRRLRFVVQFPFPDAPLRAEIWRRIFPPQTPTLGLDCDRLSRLNVAGGSIRNIALYAAFLAAEEDQPVQMHHLLRAAHVECAKLEKPLTDTEVKGWL
jgi:ATP-dependent 26S proteasome regulatory subunit